jgi:hypothetical protein
VTTKPHRLILDRVSSYADEAAAYMRRRRHLKKPFARIFYPGGRSRDFSSETDAGRELFKAAAHAIEVAGPPQRVARQARTGTPPERLDRERSRTP